MTDIFDAKKRSEIMRAVKGAGTAPERRLCEAISHRRLVFLINDKSLAGAPDLVFARVRLAVFVHGCFWHGHDCKRGARRPKANAAYWTQKIARNQKRDRTSARALRKLGYSVSTLWECRLKNADVAADRILRRVEDLSRKRNTR